MTPIRALRMAWAGAIVAAASGFLYLSYAPVPGSHTADTSLTITRLALASIVLAVLGIAFGVILGIHPVLLPVPGVLMGLLPLFWLLWRRRKRLRAFAVQLPDALEMLARGLRSGQSLGRRLRCSVRPVPGSRRS